jgi:hypothetical protein
MGFVIQHREQDPQLLLQRRNGNQFIENYTTLAVASRPQAHLQPTPYPLSPFWPEGW